MAKNTGIKEAYEEASRVDKSQVYISSKHLPRVSLKKLISCKA